MRGRHIALLFLLGAASFTGITPAHASSPRDAIKRLPRFSHTSKFHIDQNDGPSGRTYNDNYVGTWAVDWNPPGVELGPGGKLDYSVKYVTTMQDLINRIDHKSSDLRRDYFEVNLKLGDVRWLNAGYVMNHTDDYKINGEWGAIHTSSGHLSWAPPGLPSLGYGFSTTRNTRKTNAGPSVASEQEMAQYQVEYRNDEGAFGQRYFFLNQDKRSRNYLTPGGTDERTSRFEGYRLFPLGSLGKLNLTYSYNQYEHSDVSVAQASTTTTNLYTLSLNNRLPNLPLEYRYTYSDQQAENPGDNVTSIALRTLNLVVTPPTPEGKSASVGYYDELRESDQPGKRTANTKQNLSWSINPNKLTTANFLYQLETDFDRDLEDISRKREGYQGGLNYKVPGGRGNFSGNVSQWVESRPRTDASNTSDSYNLTSNLKLGQQANIVFTLGQQYGGSGSGLPGGSFDTTISSVHYRLNWRNNLGLDAVYQSQLRVQTVEEKTATNTLGVKFDYRNDANWAYTFALNFGDTRDITRTFQDSRQYETQNVIEATITYSF